MSAAKLVFRLGSVHVGVGVGAHEDSGAAAKLRSSAWPPCPWSAGVVPLLGALFAVVVPAMLPEAINWRTSLAVIGQGEPSTRLQSREGWSLPAPTALIAAL